jgi:hypothetical protein
METDLRQRLVTIRGLGNDGDVVLGPNQHGDAGSDQWLIVHDYDPDHPIPPPYGAQALDSALIFRTEVQMGAATARPIILNNFRTDMNPKI